MHLLPSLNKQFLIAVMSHVEPALLHVTWFQDIRNLIQFLRFRMRLRTSVTFCYTPRWAAYCANENATLAWCGWFTLQEQRQSLPKTRISIISDWNINIGVYGNFFLYFKWCRNISDVVVLFRDWRCSYIVWFHSRQSPLSKSCILKQCYIPYLNYEL